MLALQTHETDPLYHGYQDILLISDGDDPARDNEWMEGATAVRQQGLPIYTVGVGNPRRPAPYSSSRMRAARSRMKNATCTMTARWF